ncbi:ATP-binding protein [Catellatospora citrea]|uniref:ATPase n=1 Tax=Catellatospora citrea TaxID=53366 RepID=A0A8J3KJL0_9ACTN|nr:ATP-binding protein [Catellatospora citrea]RKE11528.1 DNA helicase HerA-like ATPase [Catellatospora citrea]GIG00029.1 ATPase [Catellatospora citrea]
MNPDERRALSNLRFDVAPVPDDVWRGSPFHVEALHDDVVRHILHGLDDARRSPDGSPIGIAMQGQPGSGKTHLLGWVREQTQRGGGYFFLVGLLDGAAFWSSATLAVVNGLQRDHLGQGSQLSVFLDRLCAAAEVPEAAAAAVTGRARLTRAHLDEFAAALRRFDGPVGMACHHTARALALLGAADDPAAQDVGYTYLQSMQEMEPGERQQWGIHPVQKPPQLVMQEMSQLLALTGPTVVAIDQIDTLVAQLWNTAAGKEMGEESAEQTQLINQIADGLMALRQSTRRTLTVLACLPSTWTLIRTRATKSVADRFREPVTLKGIASADIARDIVAKRFAVRFAEHDFVPPYATWPVREAAFAEATVFTPRLLINRINEHVQACLREGAVRELAGFTEAENPVPALVADEVLDDKLDRRFAELRESADVAAALAGATEDGEMPALLTAGLSAWIEELGEAGRAFRVDPPQGGKVPLHARLRRSLDEATEDEQHWSFRAIAHTNAIAALSRLQAARTSAGLSRGIGKRKLFLLRNADWNKGAKTQEALKAFALDGGTRLSIGEDDLRTFAALRQLLAERDSGLAAWLAARRPAGRTMLLRTVLGEIVAEIAVAGETAERRRERAVHLTPVRAADDEVPVERDAAAQPGATGPAHTITLGSGFDDGEPVRLDLESLRKHTAIFAGSGSGKTVLIRRLIEECALAGVSTIVLDPNNDLARLGDAWPEPPAGWSDGDAARSAEYLAHTDVVVWTPRRESGRPLSFQPLPEFATIRDDADEFGAAIDAAVASLAPRAKADGSTARALRGQAVLNEALRHFARSGGEGIRAFVGVLSALPDGVSQLEDAEKIAFELSQNLTAAMVTDALFGGGGAPADPGLLLTPAPGKRARVSVISLVGLPSEPQRQSFVNQLQLALFAWIKKNPAGDRPLGGLLVMDEAQTFAPSGPLTACTQSTLALASQARKYGLGLVFATQAPKGLHNRISGNAATQFFGLLNAPAQIEAAREMARAKGADVPDISRLGTGEFYASGEGFAFRKMRGSLCLSHHPKSPLTTEEVVERARR